MYKHLKPQGWYGLVILCFGGGQSFAQTPAAPPMHIVYGSPHINLQDATQMYPYKLLQAALVQSGQPFTLLPAPRDMVQSRVLKEIAEGHVDVYWSMTSIERENALRPIRIPLDKGLNGWRLLLVRRQQADLLARVHSVKALQKYIMVQGHDWPDTEVLRSNQQQVVTAPHPEQLFSMLGHQRADAFPRSVIEIYRELEKHPGQFVIAPDLVLHYPSAVYFFVAKQNDKLATLLEQGLLKLIENGQFDQLFWQRYGHAINAAALPSRRIIHLNNPLMSLQTPFQDQRLWFNPSVEQSIPAGVPAVFQQ